MPLTEESERLLAQLRRLHNELRDETKAVHGRINPLAEDLFDWKERGRYWTRDERGVTIYNSATVVGDVEIGENTWIGPFTSIDGTGGLRIGSNCSISLGCQLLTHDTVKWALTRGRHPYEYGSTTIGDCTFLGAHAVVLRSVSIGSHCVVGAGAVVTRDLPDFAIAAGVPARLVGRVELVGDDVRLAFDGGS